MIYTRTVLMAIACASVQMAAWGESSPAKSIYEELVCGTTNSWGVNQTTFQEVSNTNMMRLAKIGTEEARGYGREWLQMLAMMTIPTNTSADYRLWLGEKSAWLRGTSRRYLNADSTNLWYAVADALGRLRESQKSESEILQRHRVEVSTSGGVDVRSGLPAEYYEEMRVLAVQDETSAALGSIVVNWFGRYGLPRLPTENRGCVCSNLVIRAHLSLSERQKIENYAQ